MEEAARCKDEGGKSFGKGDWCRAILMFSRGLEAMLSAGIVSRVPDMDISTPRPSSDDSFEGLSQDETSLLRALISNRSAALLKQGDALQAESDARWCIAVDPKWPKGYFRRAACQLALGHMKPAAESLAMFLSCGGAVDDDAFCKLSKSCRLWIHSDLWPRTLLCWPRLKHKDALVVVDPRGGGHFQSLQEAWSWAIAKSCPVSIALCWGRYEFNTLDDVLVLDGNGRKIDLAGNLPCHEINSRVEIHGKSHCLVLRNDVSLGVSGVSFLSVHDCVQVWPGASIVMEDCSIRSEQEIGLACQGKATLSDCSIIDSSTGILAAQGGEITLTTMNIRGCSKAGAEMRGSGSKLVMDNVVLQDCAISAVLLHGGATHFCAKSTSFIECGTKGMGGHPPGAALSVGAGSANINTCTFKSNPEAICVSNGSKIVLNNSSISDGKLGVVFREGGHGSLSDNRIWAHSMHAVFLYRSPGAVELVRNQIMGHLMLDGDTRTPPKIHDSTQIMRRKSALGEMLVEGCGHQQLKDIRKESRPAGFRGVCEGCGAIESSGEKFQRCGGCQSIFYCSQLCQKAHWKTHKLVCKTMKA